MKKIISVLLAVLMAFTCVMPAFASTGVEHLPVILLQGDGTQIYVPDENAPNGEKNVWDDLFEGVSGSGKIIETVANILLPFLTEGLLFDKWDNYYNTFYEEIAPLFDPLRMDENGDPSPVYSIASGLDYPSVGPEHAFLRDVGRVNYVQIGDEEAMEAFYKLCRFEGIIPAVESSHAVAYAMKYAKEHDTGSILVCLSGRGDKDMDFVVEQYGLGERFFEK